MRLMLACFRLSLHLVFELAPFLALTITKSAGFVPHSLPELVDFVVVALPSGLSAYAN